MVPCRPPSPPPPTPPPPPSSTCSPGNCWTLAGRVGDANCYYCTADQKCGVDPDGTSCGGSKVCKKAACVDPCSPNPCTGSGSTCATDTTTSAGYKCTCPTCATCKTCNTTTGSCDNAVWGSTTCTYVWQGVNYNSTCKDGQCQDISQSGAYTGCSSLGKSSSGTDAKLMMRWVYPNNLLPYLSYFYIQQLDRQQCPTTTSQGYGGSKVYAAGDKLYLSDGSTSNLVSKVALDAQYTQYTVTTSWRVPTPADGDAAYTYCRYQLQLITAYTFQPGQSNPSYSQNWNTCFKDNNQGVRDTYVNPDSPNARDNNAPVLPIWS